MEHLMKEEKRRQVLHRNRIELLGEETAKKFQEEDYEQDQELLVQILEKIVKRKNPEPQHQRKRLRESKGLREAKGFDVGDIAGIPVRPVLLDSPESLERIGGYAKLALDEHNKRNNTKYRFVKVLKANIGGTLGRTYFITFQVKDRACSGSPILNFQAKVRTFNGQATVTFSTPEL
ncbi:hypothetical protein C3L33_19066, partial [Rhododendron williamsianum]